MPLLRASWIQEREQRWPRRLALAPLLPLGWLVGGAASLHRALYERGLLQRRGLAAHVISVGNLVAGGAGKTPLAAWIAQGLAARGHRVVLASRGYGRSDRGAVRVVSDGRQLSPSLARLGDEPVLLAGQLPGVPVMVGRDRGLVGLRALAAHGAEVLVLDDGFQHHRLARDVDLVCFDGAFGLGSAAVMPRGPLREFPGVLRRADAIAVIDGPLRAPDRQRVTGLAPEARWLQATRHPVSVVPLGGGPALPLTALEGQRLGMLAGIGLPAAFRRSLEALGVGVVAERIFPDHHRYRARDLVGLARGARRWITTEKDALKILPRWAGEAEVLVLRSGLRVDAPEDVLDWLAP